jgi:dTMP kinase
MVVLGRFITFEGGEGAGKSTQIKLLAERLERAGVRTIVTREPGGSAGAEAIRHVLLSGIGKVLGGDAEALLFAAARDDHVHSVIEPAQERGDWVLCDRFIDSTRVYQGKLGKVDLKLIRALEWVTIGGLLPDLTIVLDVPVDVGLARAAARRGQAAPDRFEAEDSDFHRRLREAYLDIAIKEPSRCAVVDADAPTQAVADRIWSIVSRRLPVGESAKKSAIPTAAVKPDAELAKQL